MTVDRSDDVLVLGIEGLPGRHCYPVLPDYHTVSQDTLEELYQTRSADHILAFSESDPYGDSGDNPMNDLTLSGTVARVDTTQPGCRGALDLKGRSTTNRAQFDLAGISDMGWDADRAWVMVVDHNEDGTDAWYIADDSSGGSGFGDMFSLQNDVAHADPFKVSNKYSSFRVDLTGFTASAVGKVIYVACSLDHGTSTATVYWRVGADGTKQSSTDTMSGGASSAGELLYFGGRNVNDETAEGKILFFATLSRELTSAEVDQDLALLFGVQTTDYTTTLREPLPQVKGSRWDVVDQNASIGGWRAVLAPDAQWYAVRPKPISALSAEVDDDDTSFSHDTTNTAAPISVGDELIIDRETIKVTAATGAAQTFTATRAQHGSEAVLHKQGAPVWLVTRPPALTGRLATLWLVPRTGGSRDDESDANVVARGRISREVRQGPAHRVELQISERAAAFDTAGGAGPVRLGADGTVAIGTLGITVSDEGAVTVDRWDPPILVNLSGEDVTLGGPSHNPDGSYIFYPELSLVLAIPYREITAGGRTVFQWIHSDLSRVWGALPSQSTFGRRLGAYEVIWSDPDGPYPTFGRRLGVRTQADRFGTDRRIYEVEPSGNPAVILANLLHSKDGTGNEYDLGELLYPRFSLGLAEAFLDMSSIRRAIAELDHVVARNLWLGGPKSREFEDVARGLLGPWGRTALTTRAGIWRVARMGDIYPGEAVAVTATRGRSEWVATGRPLDRLRLECDPGPDQQSARSVTIQDLTASDWYPRDFGGEQVIELAPYSAEELANQRTEIATSLTSYIRRLGQRSAIADVHLGPTDADGREVGDAVTVTDPLLRDPVSGTLEGSSDGFVVSISMDPQSGQADASVLLIDDDSKLALYPPSAQVLGWDATNFVAEVTRRKYALQGEVDSQQFTSGDVVTLYDRRGAPRSDTTNTYVTTVASISDEFLTLSGVFKDNLGATVTPDQYDIISHGYYAEAKGSGPATQIGQHAWQADGGIGLEDVGGDDPYLRGA